MANKTYDTVFLDVDGTLLWVNLDVEGYVEDLAPYSTNGPLTVERAAGPVRESMKEHISRNIHYPTREALDRFKRENQRRTARELDLDAPAEILSEVAERRISFVPYAESERVMEELREMGLGLYVVSNWDALLEEVLEELGWTRYFDGVVASALVGVEKPAPGIFEEALRLSGTPREKAVHVGNDPVADIEGAASCGLDAVYVDRLGGGEPEAPAVAIVPDLTGLPELLERRHV